MKIIVQIILMLTLVFSFASCSKSSEKKTEKLTDKTTQKKTVVKTKRKVYKPKVRARKTEQSFANQKRGAAHFIEAEKRKDFRLSPYKKINDYLAPYRADLKKKTAKVIAKLNIDLTKKGNSSTLGRFSAQIILEKAREYSKLPVDFSLLNNGGLRKPLYKGDIKIRDIYELMPFDNYIVVVSVKGSEVKKICKEIIRHHGLPMANINIVTGETNGDTCKVGNKNINSKKNYLVATINYLYNVGEGVPSLKGGKLVKNMTNHLFRDAIIEYLKEKKVINKIIPVNYHVMRK